MHIATWNLNNRVGKVRFRPEAADAAVALGADVLVFTEFFPQKHLDLFCERLADAGWSEQRLSPEAKSEDANRVLIASRFPLAPMEDLDLPTFDEQFPSNLLGVKVPLLRLTVIGVRVPTYERETAHLRLRAWEWLESTTASLKSTPTVVIGDLNARPKSRRLRRIVTSGGWHRAQPGERTSYGQIIRTH